MASELTRKTIDDAVATAVIALQQHHHVEVEYWHSGGGIMVARCEPNANYEWMFGCEDGTWGGSFGRLDVDTYGDGVNLWSTYSSLDHDAPTGEVVAWILDLLRLAPFEAFGTCITDAYADETGRFAVDPWSYYGLPYPAGALIDAALPSSTKADHPNRCCVCSHRFWGYAPFTAGDKSGTFCIRCWNATQAAEPQPARLDGLTPFSGQQ
jgi:hypothetical protein